MSSYRQQYLDSSRRRKSFIPLPKQNLKIDLSQMSDLSNDTEAQNPEAQNPGAQNPEAQNQETQIQELSHDFQSGDNGQKSPSKSKIPVPVSSLSSKPPSNAIKNMNSLHKSAVADLESKLRLKHAETTRLDTELENAKTILSNKIKEIRESAKIVKELDSIKEKNSQLTFSMDELKIKNSDLKTRNTDLVQKLDVETSKRKQIEQRNSRLENLLKTMPGDQTKKQVRGSIVKSVFYAVEHVLFMSVVLYCIYYKYVIEPEQTRASRSWWN